MQALPISAYPSISRRSSFSLRLLASRGGEGDEDRSLDMVGGGWLWGNLYQAGLESAFDVAIH
jgi:hypothetical protein